MPSIHFDITADNQDILNKFAQIANGVKGTTKAVDSAETSFDDLLKHMSVAMDGILSEIQKVNGQVGSTANQASRSFNNASDQIKAGYNAAMSEMQKSTQSLEGTVQEAAGSIKNGFMTALGFAGVNLLQQGLESIYHNVFETRAYFEDINSSMEVFLGSQEKAAEFTKQLKDYAWYNAFEFSDLAKASQQLIAYRNDVEDVIPIIDKLSNVAVGTQGNLMDLVGIYNRAKSTGVVDSEAMRTWATRGVVIKDILKDMGKAASSSTVSFEQLNEVLDYITSDGQMFHDLQGNMMSNISMSKGQLEDDITALYDDFGNAMMPTLKGLIEAGDQFVNVLDELIASAQPFFDVMNDSFDIINANFVEVADQIKRPVQNILGLFSSDGDTSLFADAIKALASNLAVLVHGLQDAVVAYGAYKVAMASSVVIKKAVVAIQAEEALQRLLLNKQVAAGVISQEAANAADVKGIAIKTLLTGAVKQYTVAAKEAVVATLSNPYILAAAAFIALSVAVFEVVTADDAMTQANKDLASTQEAMNKAMEEGVSSAMEEKKALNDTTTSVYKKIKALDRLKEKYENLEGYTLEEVQDMSDEQYKKLVEEGENSNAIKALEEGIKLTKEWKKESLLFGGVLGEIEVKTKNILSLGKFKEPEYYDKMIEGYENAILAKRKEIEQANKPIEILIQEAEENKGNKEEIVNWYNDLDELVGDFQKKKKEYANSPIMEPVLMEKTGNELDNMLTRIDDRIAELKEKAKKNPLKFQAQLDDMTKVREQIVATRDQYEKDGTMTLTWNFKANMQQAQSVLDNAIKWFKSLAGENDKGQEEVVKNYDYWNKQKTKLEGEIKALEDNSVNNERRSQLRRQLKDVEGHLAWYSPNKSKGKGGSKENPTKAKEDYNEFVAKQNIDNARKTQDLIFQARQLTLDALEDSRYKTIEEINLNYEKEKEAIKRAAEDFAKENLNAEKTKWEKDPKNKAKIRNGATFLTSHTQQQIDDMKKLSVEQNSLLDAKSVANEARKNKELKKLREEEIKSQIDYLQKFGTYAQKQQAINDEYDKKRHEIEQQGGGAYELALNERERESALAKNQMEQLKEEINWEEVFSNLDYVSTEHLKRLRDQLRAALDMGDITAENARIITEKLNEIDQQIQQKRSAWGQLFGGASEGIGGIANAIRDQEALNADAEAKRKAAEDAQAQHAIAKADVQMALKQFGEGSEEYLKAQARAEGTGKNAKERGQAAEIASGMAGNGALAMTGAIIHGVNDNVQSFAEAAELLGGKDSEFAKSAKSFAESSQLATDGFEKFKSGDFIGAALSVGQAVNKLGETFGIWSNSNVEEKKAENDKLARAMSVNTEALNRLTKAMQEGTATEKYANYEAAKAVKEQNMRANAAILSNLDSMYDGHHSTEYYFNDKGGEARLKAINSILKTNYQTLYDLYMSPQRLAELYDSPEGRQALQDLTQTLADAESAAGMAANNIVQKLTQHISEYSDEAYDELHKAFQQAVTGVSFDNFKSNFKSALMDMSKDSKDFADDFTKSLTQSLLDTQFENTFNKKLTDLYNEWEAALGDDNLSASEVASLQGKQEELAQSMLKLRNQVAAVTGYDDISTSEASGSINSAKSLSEDTANELIGRMTAVQIAVEGGRAINNGISQQVANGVALLTGITSMCGMNNEVLNSILLQHVQSNSYLEDISKYNKAMYQEWGSQITEMREKINTL